MAKEMRLRRAHTRVSALLHAFSLICASACDDGIVLIKPLVAESTLDAGESDSAGGAGGTGGAGGSIDRGGPGGRPADRGEAGSMARMPPSTLCDGLYDPDQEKALQDYFNEKVSSGDLCPRDTTGLRHTLSEDLDLQWQAHAAICVSPGRGTWFPVPSRSATTTLGWVLSDTPSLEDAKKALLDSDDIAALCDAAQRTTFRAIGVGHGGDSWSVFISPGSPEDMRRGDM